MYKNINFYHFFLGPLWKTRRKFVSPLMFNIPNETSIDSVFKFKQKYKLFISYFQCIYAHLLYSIKSSFHSNVSFYFICSQFT